ncbi:ROK family transcriptional regulator [Oceanobacillus chungangensis]|uniref:ROK family protein n=1 Tax=Oceanobacillus chungangensis TaxID=1229152 RepID=A0A3D8PR77_9BACI|nr:ROK family transcriptional regulator [Oceanobacillus chungangensis]RDW18603.1 ROK family protein [Oceanobacillus chungangensis]
MVTGDGAYIKKINRSLILKNIVQYGSISRADLSKIIGLNKATVSVQVADLLQEELIYETQQEHNTVGRRPIMLSINSSAGYALGIDLDYERIQFTVSGLNGRPIQSDTIYPNTSNYDEIVSLLIVHIKHYMSLYSNSHCGLVGVMIGIHGTVNNDESILFVPKYQWRHKNLKDDLKAELTDLNIAIENNANLSAYAEKVYKYHQSDNLLTIILTSGIGAGIMIDGKLHKGYHGYAGEMGHMIIAPDGKPCKCGNHGCWERYCSETSLLEVLSMKSNKKNLTVNDINTFIKNKDDFTLQQIKQFNKHLAIGLNNIINLYNPETIVINSKILQLYPNAVEEITSHFRSSVSTYREIVLSDLADNACVLGACALLIQRFLEVPELTFTLNEEHLAASLAR